MPTALVSSLSTGRLAETLEGVARKNNGDNQEGLKDVAGAVLNMVFDDFNDGVACGSFDDEYAVGGARAQSVTPTGTRPGSKIISSTANAPQEKPPYPPHDSSSGDSGCERFKSRPDAVESAPPALDENHGAQDFEACVESQEVGIDTLRGRLFNTLASKAMDGSLDEVINDIVIDETVVSDATKERPLPDLPNVPEVAPPPLMVQPNVPEAAPPLMMAQTDVPPASPWRAVEVISDRDQRIGELRWAIQDVERSLADRKKYCAQLEVEVANVSRSIENITKEHDLKRRALEKAEQQREELEASFQKALTDLGSSSLMSNGHGGTALPSWQYPRSELSTCTGGTANGCSSPQPTVTTVCPGG